MRRIALLVIVAVSACCLSVGDVQAAPYYPEHALFSDNDEEWLVRVYTADAGKVNICIAGRVMNDIDFHDVYQHKGDFTIDITDMSDPSYPKVLDGADLECVGGEANPTNQWFVCKYTMDASLVPGQGKMRIIGLNHDFQLPGHNLKRLDLPSSAIGTDANGNCILDSDEPQGGGSGGGFMVANQLADDDDDGVPNVYDNCRDVANADQADTDSDGVGDACEDGDDDADEDGVLDADDNCPGTFNPQQEDADADGVGDACDTDGGLPSATPPDAELDEGGMCSLNQAAGPGAAPFLMIALALVPLAIRRRS